MFQSLSVTAVIAAIYAVRMLGLFMLLPVLGLHVGRLPGATPLTVGIALGSYGLMQGILQVPFALWSNYLGRRNTLVVGLALFALGSVVAYLADSMLGIIVGRMLQGTGAIAGVLLAALGDWVPKHHRVRANAAVGVAIGLAFVLALLCAPVVNNFWGLEGVFAFNGVSALAALLLVVAFLPAGMPSSAGRASASPVSDVADLCVGVFVLHMILTACFVAVPQLLVDTAVMPPADHWIAYLIALGIAFLLAGPLMRERHRARPAPIVVASCYLLFSGYVMYGANSAAGILAGLGLFFAGFGALESLLAAMLMSRVSSAQRAASSGYYSTAQFAGAFAGGLAGGVLLSYWDDAVLLCTVPALMLLWALVFVRAAPRAGV